MTERIPDPPGGAEFREPERKTTTATLTEPKKTGSSGTTRSVKNRAPWGLLIAVVLAVVVAFTLRAFVVAPYYIPSASMDPTLHGCSGCNNDHVLVDKLSYHLHDVHRGDVVVFNRPSSWQSVPDKVLIKRVIGLPGDTLTLSDGHVFVNNQLLTENYVKDCDGVTTTLGPTNSPVVTKTAKVPPGEYFVMGDNRCASDDSRTNGPIPKSAIIGRAFLIIWPLGRISYL